MAYSINLIEDQLKEIVTKLRERFPDTLKAVILYGSWAKGTATEGSDIDMIVLFEEIDRELLKNIEKIKEEFEDHRSLILLEVSMDDFKKERFPLYTAVKKEGIILYGDVDLSINPELPEKKYADFFELSKKCEYQKIQIAEEMLTEDFGYGSAELCFIAAKHAIQACLAMKGVGYSSKVSVLLPLVKEHLGDTIMIRFKRLSELYIKSEYKRESLNKEEAFECVNIAREILKICYKT